MDRAKKEEVTVESLQAEIANLVKTVESLNKEVAALKKAKPAAGGADPRLELLIEYFKLNPNVKRKLEDFGIK